MTVISAGFCWIAASQAGSAIYAAATPVFQSILVFGASQPVWKLSATFDDGGSAIGYLVYDLIENYPTYWDVSTVGGNTSVFFPFEFTPANSALSYGYMPGVGGPVTIYIYSNKSYPSPVSGGPLEPLVFEPTLASLISSGGGTINILPGTTNIQGSGTVSSECFRCYPFRNVTSGTVSTGGPLFPTVTVTPSLASITTAQALAVTVAVSGGSANPVPTGSVTVTAAVTHRRRRR